MKPYGECDVERVRRVRDQILAEPASFIMENYAWVGDTYCGSLETVPEYARDCGTAACLCGWANVFRLRDERDGPPADVHDLDDEDEALEWLGLNFWEWRIFHARHWPEPFLLRWLAAGLDPISRARVAADFLDYICTDLPDTKEMSAWKQDHGPDAVIGTVDEMIEGCQAL